MKLKIKTLLSLIIGITFIISCGGLDNYHDLSRGYLFRGGDGDGIINYTKKRNHIILGKVVNYDFDNNFILAKQVPNWSSHESEIYNYLIRNYYINNENYIMDDNSEYFEKIADSTLRNDPYYKNIFLRHQNYWIISHKLDTVFGPLSKEEYRKKRIELKIPKALKLD